MSNSMDFPDDWKDFLKSYSFKDNDEIYTNGSELIPVFRVEQMIEHYFNFNKEGKDINVLTNDEPCEPLTAYHAETSRVF